MTKPIATILAGLAILFAFGCGDNPTLPGPPPPHQLSPPIIVSFTVLPEESYGPADLNISFLIGRVGPLGDLEIKIIRKAANSTEELIFYWYPHWDTPDWTTWAGEKAAQVVDLHGYTSNTATYTLSVSNNDGAVAAWRTVTIK